jgi:hypothetical protein
VIDKKHQYFVQAFFMALIMSCFMSLVISLFNAGLVNDFLYIWLKSWGFAFIVGFPTFILVSPVVRKLVNLVINN